MVPRTMLTAGEGFWEEEALLNSQRARLNESLKTYGVAAHAEESHAGPRLIEHRVRLLGKTRVRAVEGLARELALALAVEGLSVAPLPGTPFLGVTVPRPSPALVLLADTLSTGDGLPKELLVPLGLTMGNEPLLVDLASLPHLLVAGTTGSGKSVLLVSLLAGLLCRYSPLQVRVVLVDPKQVDYTGFVDMPHLYTPVVREMGKFGAVLADLVAEADYRYALFQRNGQRDLESFNERFSEPLPRVVVLVDEFAEAMYLAGRETQALVSRLAQMGRAAGIHLVLATQRPSVNVVTGVIKANLPARIALQVASGTDSRVVLDTGGAEQLLGRGDALCSLGGSLVRVQCPLTPDADVRALVRWWGARFPAIMPGLVQAPAPNWWNLP